MRKTLLLFCLGVSALASAQQTIDVRVKVLRPDGQPASGVEVGQMWVSEKAGDKIAPRNGLKTDKNGIASGKVTLNGPAASLLAYDLAHRAGGFVNLTSDDAGKEVSLAMQNLVPLSLKFEIPGWPGGKADGFFNVYAFVGKNMSLALARPMETSNQLLLPPGKYMIGMFSFDTSSFQKEVVVEAGKPLDLGTQKLEMSAIAKMWGKPAADIALTDARGVSKDTKLADFKGKWVLMEFWGFW